MNVLLICPRACGNIRSLFEDTYGLLLPPLGLAQIAAVLREQHHQVHIIDMNVSTMTSDELVAKIADLEPDIVGVSLISTSSYAVEGMKIATQLKARMPNLITVAGGPHATFMFTETLRRGFDYVVKYEGDHTMLELVTALQDGLEVERVNGLAFVRKGVITHTPPRPFIRSLDSLPLPARDLLEAEKYTCSILDEDALVTSVETSRGCPYACDFCATSMMWGHLYRGKSVRRTMQELSALAHDKYRILFFVDDNFTLAGNVQRAITLCQQMVEHGFNFTWLCQLRADVIVQNPELIKWGARAGMTVAFIGFESANPSTLRRYRKGITTGIAEKAVNILRRYGVISCGGFILGAPHEGEDELRATVDYATYLASHGLNAAQFTIYTPLPGSAAFQRCRVNERILTYDWRKYDLATPVVQTQMDPWRVYYWYRMAYIRFYWHKFLNAFRHPGRTTHPTLKRAAMRLLKLSPRHLLHLLRLPFDIKTIRREIEVHASHQGISLTEDAPLIKS